MFLTQKNMRWSAPLAGRLKINVDASVKVNEPYYTIGMVVRDHEGMFVAGKTMKIEGHVSVLEAESVGVLEALLWSKEFPDKHVDVESDSMLTVCAVNKSTVQYTKLGQIFQHARELLTERSTLSYVLLKS